MPRDKAHFWPCLIGAGFAEQQNGAGTSRGMGVYVCRSLSEAGASAQHQSGGGVGRAIYGFGFRVSGFGFRVSDFRFWVHWSGSRFWVHGWVKGKGGTFVCR